MSDDLTLVQDTVLGRDLEAGVILADDPSLGVILQAADLVDTSPHRKAKSPAMSRRCHFKGGVIRTYGPTRPVKVIRLALREDPELTR